MIRHLYVHIPFCPKLCPYCSFYSEISDRNKTREFLDALLVELDVAMRSHALVPETIFFGGGTPSALSNGQLEYLLGEMRSRLDLSALREWTLEMNPATVSLEKAALLLSLGVNRVSMGVQSWDETLLETLGRVHTGNQAERSFRILREAGFENLNLDLMFAVPGQTTDQWVASLEKTVSLGPEHISAYCLTYEEDTDFFLRMQKGEFVPDDEHDAELFEAAMTFLEDAGYVQYEISNYAKPSRDCLHNLAYWTGRDYIGIGPSAFSTVGERRWQNVADAAGYSSRILAGESAVSFEESVDEETRIAETLAFSLRTNRGIAVNAVAPWTREIEEFAGLGLIGEVGERLVLTRRGRLLADHIAATFI